MKWIVVLLVLLNVAAWLLGMKSEPTRVALDSEGDYRVINPEAMVVVRPEQPQAKLSAQPGSDGQAVEEDALVQLKVDRKGEVLRAVEEDKSTAPAKASPIRPVDRAAPVKAAEQPQRKQPEKQVKPVEVAPVEVAKIEKAPMPAAPEKTAEAVLACYRLGPFSNQNSLATVRRTLENQNIQYQLDERGDARSIKAVRVYLAVDTRPAAIAAARERLRQMKVDHYVITNNGQPMVQLGYFKEAARGKAYQKKLRDRGLDVKTETIYNEAKINSFLDVQMASKEAITGLKLPSGMVKPRPSCP